jgi:hypothetical protein
LFLSQPSLATLALACGPLSTTTSHGLAPPSC